MDHVVWLLPLVPLHRALGFQIPQPAEAEGLHHPYHRRQGSLKGLGVPSEGTVLVAVFQGMLQLLLIKSPLLPAAKSPIICREV